MQTSSQKREFAFTETDFRTIAGIANKITGIVLGDNKQDMIYSRIAKRLRALGLKDFKSYTEFLESENGADEISSLVNAITTNLTHFFREIHHFDHLREYLKKLAAQQPRGKKLRIWSAGCSSGMEAYSIAMVMLEAIPDIAKWDVKILATDIDTGMLAAAKAGLYDESEYDRIPKQYQRHADVENGKLKIAPKPRDFISFKPLNLMETFPVKGPFDVIFCRNVAIYFDKATQKKIFEQFAGLIADDGWIYIGHSENLFQVTDTLTLIGKTIYRKTL